MYRVAHNVAAGHVIRQRRLRDRLVDIESLESVPDPKGRDAGSDDAEALRRLSAMIERLKPLDRQVIVCYLEGMDANSTSEITGLSPSNVAVKVHRIKRILKTWFDEGGPDA